MLIDLLLFLPLAILTNTAFPFPFDYVLIFFAENYEPHQVWVFAALGSVCAAAAGFVDIKVLTAVGEWTGRGKRWQAWNLDRSWFYAAVFLCAFLPVPYLLVRLVLVRGSPHPVLYAATLGSARLPRYVIIVYFWQQLNLPPWASAALVASALPFGLWHWWHGSSSPASLPITPPDAPRSLSMHPTPHSLLPFSLHPGCRLSTPYLATMNLPSAKFAVCLAAVTTYTACTARTADESTVPQRHLSEPDAAYPEALGMIQTVRTLPDGRVLVADPLGQVLVAIDMDAGTADTIGRRGAGPGEYDQPDAVLPLPGDSTLLIDLGNGRLTVLGPDLEPGATMPLAFGDPQRGDMTFILPRGTDNRGRIYFQGMGIKMGGPGLVEFPDSAPIMRFDRETKSIDTVGMIRLRRREAFTSGTGARLLVEVAEYALSPEDAWHVSPNGRVAAARTDGYYIEWIDDEGSHPGPDVPYIGVPVRRADQDEWINDFYAMSMGFLVRIVNNVRTTSFSRGGPGSDDRTGPEGFEWPDAKPPFITNGVRVSPTGEAWVHRSIPAGAEVVYDVFDADGRRTEQVIFPPERRVVGFRGEFVFVVRKDEFDLFWLERYRRF